MNHTELGKMNDEKVKESAKKMWEYLLEERTSKDGTKKPSHANLLIQRSDELW